MKAFVIFRDRVSYAKQCVDALQSVGLQVHIVDQDSTYPPAVDWLATAPAEVHRVANQHPRQLWEWGDLLKHVVGSIAPYVVTDCDVVPGPLCPDDWAAELRSVLERNPDRCKVGMALQISSIPDHYKHKRQVQDWEAQHWVNIFDQSTFGREILYGAAVDTTLAMYQPLGNYPNFALGPALRTGYPYTAQHLSWYEESANPTEEQVYYEAHMNRDFSHWIAPERYA